MYVKTYWTNERHDNKMRNKWKTNTIEISLKLMLVKQRSQIHSTQKDLRSPPLFSHIKRIEVFRSRQKTVVLDKL